MPKFSIIMPCYNAIETVDASIAAIVAQTNSDWELICIDDGSTDGTVARLKSWALMDPRIQVLAQQNKGPSAARNRGATRARGDILCFCDADDLWIDTKLDELAQCFANPVVQGAFGQIAFFRTMGTADTYSTVPNGDLTIPLLMGENPVCTMSNIAVRRVLFLQYGGFRLDMVHNEDLEWLIRMVGMGAIIRPINRLQVWYRTSSGGLSSDLRLMQNSRQRALKTAAQFGFKPRLCNEAIYLRYLARRALRLDKGRAIASRFALRGIFICPRGFLFPLRRGGATAIAAFIAPLLPTPISRKLFAK